VLVIRFYEGSRRTRAQQRSSHRVTAHITFALKGRACGVEAPGTPRTLGAVR